MLNERSDFMKLGSRERQLLIRTIIAVGMLEVSEAFERLYAILADRKRDSSIRVSAAFVLGRIDIDGCKELLLQSADPAAGEHPSLRQQSIKALGGSSDPNVASALDSFSAIETDPANRELLRQSARRIRSKQ